MLSPQSLTVRHACRVQACLDIDRARGALLGTFVGDAVGMPFEGAEPVVSTVALEMRARRVLARGRTPMTRR